MGREFSRRSLLRNTALAGAGIGLLADCAGQTPAQDLSQVVGDVSLVASGLAGVLPQIAAIDGIPQDLVTKVSGWVQQIQAVAAQIGSAVTSAEAQPLVQQLVNLVQAIVDALPADLLPPGVSIAVAAAAILLPVIEQAVGLLVTPPTARMLALGHPMTPAEARAVLRRAG